MRRPTDLYLLVSEYYGYFIELQGSVSKPSLSISSTTVKIIHEVVIFFYFNPCQADHLAGVGVDGRVGETGVKRVVLFEELSFFDLLSLKFIHTP